MKTAHSRLDLLNDYGLVNNANLNELSGFAAMAASMADLPIALVNFLKSSGDWFSTIHGTLPQRTAPELALCRWVVDSGRTRMVSDLHESSFSEFTQVPDSSDIRFFAGVPLVAHNGTVIGTLSVMDNRSRTLSSACIRSLETLARQVMTLLESRREQIRLRHQLDQRDNALLSRASMMDAVPANVVLLDGNGVIIETNAYWRKFARDNDYGQEHWGLGENYLEVCRSANQDSQEAEDAAAVSHGLEQVLRGKVRGFAYEYPCHSKNTKRWFRMLAEALSYSEINNSANQGRAVVMHLDITERKLAEKESDLMRFSVDNATDGIVWLRSDGTTRYVNRAISRMMGYDRDELSRMTVFDGLPMLTPEMWRKQWSELKRWGSTSCESPGQTRDGSPLMLEVRAQHMGYDGEEYTFTSVRDITERRKTDQEYRSKQRYQDAIQQMSRVAWHQKSLTDYLQYILELTVDTLALDQGMVLRIRGSEGHCLARTGLNPWNLPPQRFELAVDGELSRLLKAGQVVSVEDWGLEDKARKEAFPFLEEARSSALLPLLDHQGAWGLIWLGARYSHVFSVEAEAFLQQVVNLASEQMRLRQSRDTLRHSQHLVQVASRLVGLAGWSIELPHYELNWSDELGDMLGFLPGEVPSLETALSLLPPRDRDRVNQSLRRCEEQGLPFNLDLQMRTLGGERLDCHFHGYPVYASDGTLERIEGALQSHQ
ncbi:MAG: PAS domain S-box protein [Oleiphilaceae bacterium]|nr:PAS domain S-box protein [Oleiphilaceae bacterium]